MKRDCTIERRARKVIMKTIGHYDDINPYIVSNIHLEYCASNVKKM